MTIIDQTWYERLPGLPEAVTAGGVVVRVEGGQVYVALARSGGEADYILPKGHVDDEDDGLEDAARREIEEEAGFSDLELLGLLGVEERMDFDKTEWKKTYYYLFRTRQVESRPTDPGHPPADWYPLETCPDLFWPEQTRLLRDNRNKIMMLVMDSG